MSYLAVNLQVVETPEHKGHVFANNMVDDGPSVLCLSRRAQVPLSPGEGSITPVFGGVEYFTWLMPREGTKIVGLVGSGADDGRQFAEAWTMASLWRAARQRYTVVYHTPKGTQEVWTGNGILELSYSFPTSLWEPGGVFWRNPDRTCSMQIITRTAGGSIAHGVGPKRDPRVLVSRLDWKYRDREHELLWK